MRCALACAALAGCVPVSWRVSPTDVRAAAPTLPMEGSAIVPAEKIDDGPSNTASSANVTELITLDQPIRVRLVPRALPWYQAGSEPSSAPQAVTVADLFADCPNDLDAAVDVRRLGAERDRLDALGRDAQQRVAANRVSSASRMSQLL